MKALRLLLPVLCAIGMATSAAGFVFDEKTNSTVEVKPVFNAAPPSGCMPVQVEIRNNTDAPVQCAFTFTATAPSSSREQHTFTSQFTCSGEKGKTTVHSLIVPLFPDLTPNSSSSGHAYYYGGSSSNGSVRWKETSLSNGNESGSAGNIAWMSDTPFVAFSKSLTGTTLPAINGQAASVVTSGPSSGPPRGGNEFAADFDPKQLPEDWRAWSGVDAAAMTVDNWVSLNPGAQLALRQWIIGGGTLDIYHTGSPPSLDSLRIKTDNSNGLLGAGKVRFVAWNGKDLGDTSNVTGALGRYKGETSRRDYYHESQGGGHSALTDAIGERAFAAWQVGIILLIFGILVGPVNLFKFAGPGRRHRLFFTTPIISLAASLLLIAVIFFQDGTGGTGRRVGLVYLRGEENIAWLRQEQISRTGVLFSGSFTTAEPAVVQPLLLPENRWRRLKQPESSGYPFGRSSSGDNHRFSVEDKKFAGDWFQSRSEQAQSVASVRSTRGRIELASGAAGSPPAITSSLPCALERLFYAAPAGKIWCSPGTIAPGQTVTLWASTQSELDSWRTKQVNALSHELRDAVLASGEGMFIATARSAEAGLMDTLSSIKWEDDLVILYGPL